MNKEKEFDNWNNLKKKIDFKKLKIFYKERDIWWANLGKNVGVEQDGKNNNFTRPILILMKFNKNSFWGLPTSTQEKRGKYFYTFKRNDIEYSINLSQLRLFSSKRLFKKLSRMSKKDFENIKDRLMNIFKRKTLSEREGF
jgi:mRNA interferase MazF